MSGSDARAKVLAEVTALAKAAWVPPPQGDIDDDARALFARIDRSESRASPTAGRPQLWVPVAVAAAMAAGVALYARPHEEGPSVSAVAPVEHEGPVARRPTAPAVVTAMTGGDLVVDGINSAGATLHDGTSLATHGGTAAFAAPGRVAWLLEDGTEVGTVRAGTHGGAIVLALQVGAVEAQVMPVPAGEAFAVDVDGVRVAVHGTHLRVARAERGGSRVVVDLSEGVISVGAPPKAGSTVGILVTAPAHVEFSVADLDGTLRVDHDPAHVRPAVDPARVATTPASTTVVMDDSREAPREVRAPRLAPPPATPRGAVAAVPVARPVAPESAEERLAAAVRSCAERTAPPASGSLTIRSTVVVDVKDDGEAALARFDPPLPPDLQACVAGAVYAIHWGEPGPRQIPVELHR